MSWKYSGFKRIGTNSATDSNKLSKTSFDYAASLVQSNNVKAIQKILKHKNVELVDAHQLTVLHVAAQWADEGTLTTLLSNRRVSKLIDHQMYSGDTPLLIACHGQNLAAVRLLLEHGADVEVKELNSGSTVLHVATLAPSSDVMSLLLAQQLPSNFINITNVFGDTPLQLALKQHSPTLQLLLQAGADYSTPNSLTGRNIMHTGVAYGQCGILNELLNSKGSQKLVDLADNRGDTPFMIALRLGCSDCVKSLIPFLKPGKEINNFTTESILHLAVQSDDLEIVKHVLMFCRENVINHTDNEGMTPLLYAIENKKDNCLERLFCTQSVYVKNSQTSDTVLHSAIRADNISALKILFQPNYSRAISWCLSQSNKDRKTPIWLAVENDNVYFVVESRKADLIDVQELNGLGDSLFYVAAASGNLQILKALLLSNRYYNFCRMHEEDADLEENAIFKNAEVCCDIYTTDIFLLKNLVKKHQYHFWVPNTFVESNKGNGRNIYHACAIGSNLDCLGFVHSYFNLFDLDAKLFDGCDKKGNTPLLLATKNNSDCAKFFLTNGANVSNVNMSGDSVLKSLLVYVENSVNVLEAVLNEGIIYDPTFIGLQEESECLQIDFTLFRPPNQPVTKVVKLFFETIQGSQRTKLLQHTLFKVYIHLILISVSYFFMVRFVISCCSTVLLSFYIIFYLSHEEKLLNSNMFHGVRYILSVLSVSNILFSVPILYHHSVFKVALMTYTLTLLPCVLVICLIQLPYGSDLSFEIAALTVLVSWVSLLMYSTAQFKEISNQIAMLTKVIHGMVAYFRIVVLILLPFSLAFYCIFRHDPYFSTPGKSFFYTSIILLPGDTDESVSNFEAKHFNQSGNLSKNISDPAMINSYIGSQMDLVFESIFLLVFMITCVLGLLNMLVGLAVRDGKTLAADGEVFRRNLQIHWLSSLEMFLKSFIYKVLRWTHLIYIFGIIPSKTIIDVQIRYSPMRERKSYIFSNDSLMEMKKSVVNAEESNKRHLSPRSTTSSNIK